MSSSCCGAKVHTEINICSKCKEHCEDVEVHCYSCDWEGKEEELIVDGEFTQEDGFVGASACPKCHKLTIEDVK